MYFSSLALWALVLYFGFLFISLIYRSQVITGPWLFLLRSFFPNWRFFHRMGHVPTLYVRYAYAEHNWSAWQSTLPRAQRSLMQLFHNPEINLALANQNLVDHLSADLQVLRDDQNVEELVTYQLITRHARNFLQQQQLSFPIQQYQFQLRLMAPPPDKNEDATVLTSPAIAW
jgi:hypothetical protein